MHVKKKTKTKTKTNKQTNINSIQLILDFFDNILDRHNDRLLICSCILPTKFNLFLKF